MSNREPNCPARVAAFRESLKKVALDTGSRMYAELHTPIPCVESIQTPGRCVHCERPMRNRPEPHADKGFALPADDWEMLPTAALEHPDDATLDAWRSDADRWARCGMPVDERFATQRIATLIEALRQCRECNRELSALALSKAAELSARVEAMGSELKALRSVALLRGRAPFSSTPAVLEGAGGGGPDFSSTTAVGGATGGGGGGAFRTTRAEVVAIDDPICSIRSEAVGMPVPCFASHAHPGHVARCTFCDRTMLPLHHPKG